MPKKTVRSRQVWLIGLAGQPARRISQSVGDAAEARRMDPRDLPGRSAYDRAAPLAVFLDVESWRALAKDGPAWLAEARKVLVVGADGAPSHEEVLSKGFLACLSPPLNKAKVSAALARAREAEEVYGDIARLLGEAQRERERVVRENGRLAFFQHVLARAMGSLDIAAILSGLRDDLKLAFPVSEVLGVFWGQSQDMELFLPAELDGPARSARTDYLLDLAARLSGGPARSWRLNGVPGGQADAPGEPGRALLVPMRQGAAKDGKPFGCLSVLIHRDLSRAEQDMARQAVSQLAPCLSGALDYQRLRRRADRDGLTGLANRRSLDARLDQELRRHMRHKEGFALFMADLDHFKAVNDMHGHLAGDAALRHAAQTLEAGLRSTDFLARYGGEEFVAVLPHTGQSQAWMLAERLRRRVAASPLRYAGRVISLTASLGLAAFTPGQAATPASLLAQADQALYAAKHAGRNRVSVAHGRGEPREPALAEGLIAG